LKIDKDIEKISRRRRRDKEKNKKAYNNKK